MHLVSRVLLTARERLLITYLESRKVLLHLCQAGAAHVRDRGESLVLRQTRQVRHFGVVCDCVARALRGVRGKLEAVVGHAVGAASRVLRVVPVRVEPLEEMLTLLASTLVELPPDLRAPSNGDLVERLQCQLVLLVDLGKFLLEPFVEARLHEKIFEMGRRLGLQRLLFGLQLVQSLFVKPASS